MSNFEVLVFMRFLVGVVSCVPLHNHIFFTDAGGTKEVDLNDLTDLSQIFLECFVMLSFIQSFLVVHAVNIDIVRFSRQKLVDGVVHI